LNKFLRGISLYLLIAIIAVSIVSNLYSPGSSAKELYYSEFLQYIDENKVASVRMVGEQHLTAYNMASLLFHRTGST